MRENLRRPLLFLITVGAGSLIIAIDAPVEVILASTVLAGFLALVVTGALDLADLKPSRLRSALRERAEREERPESGKEGTTPPDPSLFQRLAATEIDPSRLPEMLGTFAASIREAIMHARAPEDEKEKEIKKIDSLLDQAVDGAVPDQPTTPSTEKTGGGVIDPLASLADLEIDLDSLEDLDLDGATSDPGMTFASDQISLLSEEEADAVSEILEAHQNELDDSEEPLPAGSPGTPSSLAYVGGLPGDDGDLDMGALSEELSALTDLDFDDVEIEIEGEGEGAEGEDEELDEAVNADLSDADGVVPEEPEEEPEEDFDMVSFASGGTVDNDLIAALKSDVEKRKEFVEDLSLVRELKGKKFPAEELAADLEEILAMLKPK